MKLNLDFLIKSPIEKLVENLDVTFKKLLQEIESYLNLEPIDKKINIYLNDKELSGTKENTYIFSLGADRLYENKVLNIHIYKSFFQFIPIILLREAYKCFVPELGNQMKFIDIFINEKISIDLGELKSIKDWNLLIRENLVDYEFISKEYNRLENFLKRDSIKNVESPFRFGVEYIRKNFQIIKEKQDDFYDTLFKEYLLISSKSLYDDEIVETIRVLVKIFDEIQYYTALLDYQHYFKEFKESGLIKTSLSLFKFTENMQWIKQFSTLSPAYKINWPALNIYSINCFMKFNPIIKRSKINQIIKELPFFVLLKECNECFGFEIDGFFVIPKQYFNDLKRFLKKCEDYGYVLQIKLTLLEKAESFVNLNYYREYHNEKMLVNREIKSYDKNYEFDLSLEYGQGINQTKLSLLDWLLIDRVRYFSQSGLNFERQAGILKLLKSDLINEVISQKKFIDDLKFNLSTIHSFSTLRDDFLEFIKLNESYGFFYIKNMLHKYTIIFDLIQEVLDNNPSIDSEFKFLEHIKKQGVPYSIENNIILNNFSIKKVVFKEFLPMYYKSKTRFKKEIDKFNSFYRVIKSCYDLKIFNLKSISIIIKDESLLITIFKSKEEKLQNSYENYKLSEITYQLIEDKLDNFLNNTPPVIKPNLFVNIQQSMVQYYILILKNNSESVEHLKKISYISKRMGLGANDILYVVLFLPNLNSEEKRILISIVTNIFNENLISIKRFVYSGLQEAFSRKDFFDLEEKEFFYTRDLFEQFFLNVRSILGDVQKPLPEIQNMQQKRFWSEEKDVSYLIKEVEDRVKNENIDLSSENLRKLIEFQNLLSKNILNIEEFKKSQEKFFFKNYINSIYFIPAFQNFGISQYFLYFYPTDINQIDFKLLLNNAFQSIHYPAQIDNSNSFVIQFIYPHRNPGVSPYINWLTKSKKIIREYCLFFVKKFYQILHFDYNLSSEGWDLDPNRFKMYFQNVLFNSDYKVRIPDLKEFNIGDLNYLGLDSSEFKALSQIYNWKSLDIKSYLTRRYFKINASISELLKKGLIQPFISLKNLDLVEEITIILPNVKKEHNESILKIFSFFNIGFIYEMEGEYYIHGFENVMKFENGVMIKLYFPDCQIDEFEKLLDLLFEYMEIDHYIILNDLVDGENLIKSTFEGLKFLETYNPLTNLIWNDEDKRWQNHKLFNENFEPVYPDLFFGKNNYDLDS